MNDELKFANKLRESLTEGGRLEGVRGAAIAKRLHAAREQALARRRTAREPAFALAGAEGVIAGFGGFGGFSLRLLLPTFLLVAGLIGIYSWQQEQRAADIEELDAQLLTDDLPIDAYPARGFEAWLQKRAPSR